MGWRRVLEGGQAEVGGGDARGSASRGVRLAMPANRRPARAPPALGAIPCMQDWTGIFVLNSRDGAWFEMAGNDLFSIE